MSDPTILLDFGAGVATITLNRPDKLNAINEAMHGELARALDRIEADPAIRARPGSVSAPVVSASPGPYGHDRRSAPVRTVGRRSGVP